MYIRKTGLVVRAAPIRNHSPVLRRKRTHRAAAHHPVPNGKRGVVYIEYYDRMSEVRRGGNYEQRIKFFLTAIYESAEDAALAIDKLTALHDKNITKRSE